MSDLIAQPARMQVQASKKTAYEHINFSQQGHASVLAHPQLRERAVAVSSFVKNPTEKLLSKEYAAEIRKQIQPEPRRSPCQRRSSARGAFRFRPRCLFLATSRIQQGAASWQRQQLPGRLLAERAGCCRAGHHR